MAIDVDASNPLQAAANTKVNNGTEDSALVGNEPVIIDFGKKKKKAIRKLRRGKPGRLLSKVEDTIEQLRASGEFEDGVRPIIIVVRQKARRSKRGRRAAKLWGLG